MAGGLTRAHPHGWLVWLGRPTLAARCPSRRRRTRVGVGVGWAVPFVCQPLAGRGLEVGALAGHHLPLQVWVWHAGARGILIDDLGLLGV